MPQDLAIAGSVLVALAFIAMVGFVVARLSQTAPTRMVATIAALVGLVAALPAILIALYGR